MLPLVRRILQDIREARSRLCRLDREAMGLDDESLAGMNNQRTAWRAQLAECLRESAELGIAITAGVRCEALFPFDHQWIGPQGDNKIRPAYFVYNDANGAIEEWFFSGWPNDRRKVNPKWLHQFRTAPAARMRIKKQSA